MTITKKLLLIISLSFSINSIFTQEKPVQKKQKPGTQEQASQKKSWKDYINPQNLFKINFFGSAILLFGQFYHELTEINKNLDKQALFRPVFMKNVLINEKKLLDKTNTDESKNGIKAIENCEDIIKRSIQLDVESQ